MVTQELLGYIQGELARGIEKHAIIQALVASGWALEDANYAFATPTKAQKPMPPEPPVLSPVSTTPSAVQATSTVNPSEDFSQIALKEKAAQIETIYDSTISKVTELGGKQRQVVANSINELEQRKLDEVKKRLGMP